jgi:pimeloyl-ACP methyl ester carboxylesterase
MAVEFLTLADATLAYQRQVGDPRKPGIFFLGGFASDMTGTKAAFLAERCAAEDISYVRFDYSSCGQSPGDFTHGTIGTWLRDSLAIFDQLTQGAQIIVGSSMGGWLGMLLARERPTQIKAFIGIAAAPDFTEELVWKKLTAAQRGILLRDGKIYEDNAQSDHRVPMTLKLIEEARQYLIFSAPFTLSCPMRLLQGKRDQEVPWDYAQKITNHVECADSGVTLMKNGDHRLGTPDDLDALWQLIAPFL